jgi:hypothetical protein
MGWNDHDPAFSWIETEAELLEEAGYPHDEAWSIATQRYQERWD